MQLYRPAFRTIIISFRTLPVLSSIADATMPIAAGKRPAVKKKIFCLYPVFGSPTSTIVIIVPAEEQIQNPTTGALLTVAALPAAAAAHFGALAH